MKKNYQFAFPSSELICNLPPQPQENPSRHLIPEQMNTRVSIVRDSRQSSILNKALQQNSSFALQYSPQIPIISQAKSSILSPFKRTNMEQINRKYVVKPYQTKIQAKLVSNHGQHQSTANVGSKVPVNEINEARSTKKIAQNFICNEINSKESKVSNNSIVRKLNIESSNQNTHRHIRESNFQKQSLKQAKGYNKSVEQSMVSHSFPQNYALLNQNQQLRQRVRQIQQLNSTLTVQLQAARQKIVTKEVQYKLLNDQNSKVNKNYQQLKQSQLSYKKRESQFLENKNLMDFFCQQIEQQKKVIQNLQHELNSKDKQLETYKAFVLNRDKNIQIELQQYKQRYNEMSSVIDNLNSKNSQLEKQVNQLHKSKQQMAQIITHLQKLFDQSQHQKKQLHLNLEVATNTIDNNTQQINKLKKENQEMTIKINRQELLIKRNQQQITDLQLKIFKQKEQFQKLLLQFQQNKKSQMKNIREINERLIRQLNSQIEQKSGLLRQSILKIKNIELQIQRLNMQKNIYLNQLKTEKVEKTTLLIEKKEMSQKISKLQLNQNQLKLSNKLLADLVEHLKGQVEKITAQLKKRQVQYFKQIEDWKKAQDQSIRLGKQKQEQTLRSSKQKQDQYQRQYKQKQDQLLRSYKRKQDQLLRQCKQKQDQSIKLGKQKQEKYLKLCQQKQDQYLRLSQQKQTQYMNSLKNKQFEFNQRLEKQEKIFDQKQKQKQTQKVKLYQIYVKQKQSLQAKISQNIIQKASKQLEIVHLNNLLHQSANQKKNLINTNMERQKIIYELQQRQLNYQKLLKSYKDSLVQQKESHQQKWQSMKQFYQSQCSQLEVQLKEMAEQRSRVKSYKSYKKSVLKQQSTNFHEQKVLIGEMMKVN